MSSFNVRAARKEAHRETYDKRHGFQEPEDPDFGRLPGDSYRFPFLLDY